MINLYCLPYAGGSANVYSRWRYYADKNIKVIPVELAGRGKRLGEPLYKSMQEAIDDVFNILTASSDENSYALFGHSMGSSLVFELSHKMIQATKKEPVHLFVSGRCPPFHHEGKKLSLLPDNEFKKEVLDIGGTPKEIFENEELCDIFLPILKADYRIIDAFEHSQKNVKLDCGISVLNGREDKMTTLEKIQKWRDYTTGKTEIYEFDGGHFFINSYTEQIMDIVNRTLSEFI